MPSIWTPKPGAAVVETKRRRGPARSPPIDVTMLTDATRNLEECVVKQVWAVDARQGLAAISGERGSLTECGTGAPEPQTSNPQIPPGACNPLEAGAEDGQEPGLAPGSCVKPPVLAQ